MALDQATIALLEQMAASGAKPLHELTPAEARGVTAAMRGEAPPGPDMASVRDARIRVSGGFVPVRVLVPVERPCWPAPRGVIVYYHGGGWVLGGLPDFDKLGRQLAQRTGCAVILVDYRLAPEYRFPTAVDDAWAALRWADEHRAELAGPVVSNTVVGNTVVGNTVVGDAVVGNAAPLIVAGDSAGGNLSAVMTQRAKAAGGPAIALQVLVYPVTDCDLESTSYLDPANQLIVSRDAMAWFWDHYAPDPQSRVHPDAAPLRSTDLAGLPPAVILTAEHDPLRDEGELYATRLMKAGVQVRHRRFDGQMHGFFTMVDALPGAAEGLDYVVAAIGERLASEPLSPV
jgi:acetyl esterase